MSDRGHDFGSHLHGPLRRRRQGHSPCMLGCTGVLGLIGFHLSDYGARSRVVFRQLAQVALQVRLDLALGFDHKT